MSLREYRRRRPAGRSPEPAGRRGRRAEAGRLFVIQLHHARARHFDFRLELDGVLRSWAVPKGPSLRPGDKRLAVEVEDHPLDYAAFEGRIPAGEYGAGEVRIVEQGEWTPDGDARRALAAGKLDFSLQGRHLRGAWTLVRTGRRGSKPQWLLIKRDDEHAADTDLDTLVAQGSSTAAAGDWAARALALAGARRGRPDARPQLATLRDQAPEGDDWLHEIKWDGYRLLAARQGSRLQLQSRNGTDWTGRFAGVESALSALPVDSLLLDAELVALDARGHADFALLQSALEGIVAHPVSAIAFDLLGLEGVDLTGCTQLERKTLLREVLASAPSPWLAYGEHLRGQGPRVLARALADGHEGIISKRADAPYRAGRQADWLKIKRRDGFEAIVVGFTAPRGARQGLGALLLAVREGATLRYVGRVGSGLGDRELQALRARLDRLHTDAPPVALPAHVPLRPRDVRWVRPELVVEIEHRGWGKQGLLRQASFLRLRPDKPAAATSAAAPVKAPRLTHPERVVFPRPRLSKRDVADYYQAVASWFLPEVRGRPLSLLRAPEGLAGERFFQKHASEAFGDAVGAIAIREKSGQRRDYLRIDDVDGLLALVQANALEFHPWGACPGQPERPDRLTFDLDPGPGVDWHDIVQAAVDIRGQLERVGLQSHALLSGGKGVHVVVPLEGHDGWEGAKRFARSVARVLAEAEPARFVAVAAKQARRGRIFIDWLRNGRGATSVAPWSLRARPGAPVAMPVDWESLSAAKGAAMFDLRSALEFTRTLERHPWGDYRGRPQRLPGMPAAGDDPPD